MKRFLHALAALWPKKRATGSPPLADPSTAIPQHLAAVLRMERILSGFAEEAVGAGTLSTVRDQLTESSAQQRPESPDTRLIESPDTQPTESTTRQLTESSAQQRPESPDTRLIESTDTRLVESPDTRLPESTTRQIDGSTAHRINEYTTNRLDDSPNQPQSLPRIPQPMPLLTILMLVFFMCLMAAKQVSAQAEPAEAAVIKPLQIGDTIPEELWHLPLQVVNHPEGKETITLNDYRGKLIILDFWGTFCGSCIAAMPKINEVQQEFSDDMVIVPISWSKPDATEHALLSHRTLAPLALYSVVDAKPLIDIFPHGVVPHYAWINPQGKIVATTATNDVILDNIAKVLEGGVPNYALAKFIDPEKPLLLSMEDLPTGAEVRQYGLFVRGMIPGVGSTTRLRKTGETVHGMAIYNRRLSAMYKMLATKLMGENPGKRFVYINAIEDDIPSSLDFIVEPKNASHLYPAMLDFLNLNSAYVGQLVKQTRLCLALVKHGESGMTVSSDANRFRELTDSNFTLKNAPISLLVARLNNWNIADETIVLNETGYDGAVNIHLEAPFDDLANIRRQLKAQGLDLVQMELSVDVFEIRRRERS